MRKVPYPSPGEIPLEEFLKPMGISAYRLAKEIAVPQMRISEVIAGKRSITGDTGLRRSRYFGVNDGYCTGLQLDHDAARAKDEVAAELAKIRPPHRLTKVSGVAMRKLAEIVLLQLAAVSSTAFAQESAERVIAKMNVAYASLASYSDVGVVRTYILPLVPNETTFSTSYVRPEWFKFSWVMSHPFPPLSFIKWRSVIWSNATGAYFWWELEKDKGVTRVDGLSDAVARATGVSGGAAPTIASLLIPGSARDLINDLSSLQMLGTETVDDVSCDHIAGDDARRGRYELWIGRDDHLLRKLASTIAGFRSEEVRRDIRVNVKIPESVFLSEK